jgi:hypothetical protein
VKLVLEVIAGPGVGRKIHLSVGQQRSVGRGALADETLPDERLANTHFELRCDFRACRVRDVAGSGGTYVNGRPVAEVALKDGDRITAGSLTFLVRLTGTALQPPDPFPLPLPAPVPDAVGLADYLRNERGALYAVLDGAREYDALRERGADTVAAAAARCGEPCRSLLEGPRAEHQAAFGPWLVRVADDGAGLERLLAAGWGRAWGVFLSSPHDFDRVRDHLRRFLFVETQPKQLAYFRFYDPRVLRLFLPTCDAEQGGQLFDGVGAFLVEGPEPSRLLRFERDGREVRQEEVAVAGTNAGG